MGILRFGIVGIEIRKPHVGNLAPLSRLCLYISIVYAIKRVYLYGIEELERDFYRFFYFCLWYAQICNGSPHIFAHTIEHETNGVELLFGVFGIAQIVHRPITAAIFAVNEMVDDMQIRCVL